MPRNVPEQYRITTDGDKFRVEHNTCGGSAWYRVAVNYMYLDVAMRDRRPGFEGEFTGGAPAEFVSEIDAVAYATKWFPLAERYREWRIV